MLFVTSTCYNIYIRYIADIIATDDRIKPERQNHLMQTALRYAKLCQKVSKTKENKDVIAMYMCKTIYNHEVQQPIEDAAKFDLKKAQLLTEDVAFETSINTKSDEK